MKYSIQPNKIAISLHTLQRMKILNSDLSLTLTQLHTEEIEKSRQEQKSTECLHRMFIPSGTTRTATCLNF
jgi:hypothetical protein